MKKPFIIGIGGAHSGSGKTTLAAALLKHLSSETNTLSGRRWGAIKFTKTAFYSSVTDDRSILNEKDKDTHKMLEAGAEEVLWVQSPAEDLGEVLPMAADRLSHLDGIVVEGNSAIEFLGPDIVIFLEGDQGKDTKPSASRLRKLADIIIERQLDAEDQFNEKSIHELVIDMENAAKHKAIPELLKERASEGRITCAVARKIAEELGVPYKEVGKAANDMKIKIQNCELGCF